MGFFHKIGNAIARFMYGRNGMDQLNRVLFWAFLGIWIAQMLFMAVLHSHLLGVVCDVVLWALMIVIFFRMFSKNLSKRREENGRLVNWLWRTKSRRAGAKERHADKDHKYFTCKQCKAICRVPVGKGKIVITCPKCGAEIHAKT